MHFLQSGKLSFGSLSSSSPSYFYLILEVSTSRDHLHEGFPDGHLQKELLWSFSNLRGCMRITHTTCYNRFLTWPTLLPSIITDLGWHLANCSFNKHPSDPDAAHLWTSLLGSTVLEQKVLMISTYLFLVKVPSMRKENLSALFSPMCLASESTYGRNNAGLSGIPLLFEEQSLQLRICLKLFLT